jgi:hypothetical protein
MQGIPWLAEELLATQDEFWFMQLVIYGSEENFYQTTGCLVDGMGQQIYVYLWTIFMGLNDKQII